MKEYNKNYKKKNREKIKEYNKNYNIANRKQIQIRQTKQHKKRRKTDIKYKLSIVYRNRLRKIMKNIYKDKSSKELLGCPRIMFVEWITFLLNSNQKLNLHGKQWHLDHTIACSLFNLQKKIDITRCFHWSNIKPLNKHKNLSKQNKTTLNEIILQEIKEKYFIKNFCGQYKYTMLEYNKSIYIKN